MRLSFAILCLLLIVFTSRAQTESPAQTVTNRFVALAALSNADSIAVKKAVASLEAKGLYDKLLSLNIGKFFSGNKCYNVIVPIPMDGAFTLTVEAGAPEQVSNGIRLNSSGDQLNTHFVNDRATEAPYIGVFWYTDIGVDKPILVSNSPFNIEPRYGGKAYISFWSSSFGIDVPETPPGFCMAQRPDINTVEFYQGATAYTETLYANSPNPTGYSAFIQGNDEASFVLKVFGFTKALTAQQVSELKVIIDQLVTDLGI